MELTTGKAANYGDEHSSLAQWAWRHFQVGSNIEELLDKEVVEPSHMDEMCRVFKLGVMCTATHPATRPTMKKALKILLSALENHLLMERGILATKICDILNNLTVYA